MDKIDGSYLDSVILFVRCNFDYSKPPHWIFVSLVWTLIILLFFVLMESYISQDITALERQYNWTWEVVNNSWKINMRRQSCPVDADYSMELFHDPVYWECDNLSYKPPSGNVRPWTYHRVRTRSDDVTAGKAKCHTRGTS